MNISVCIPAYNEEKNIYSLLNSFAEQKKSHVHIQEVIVVASGCTDKTIEIVQAAQKTTPHLKLIIQKKRQGKAAAINAFLEKASQKICVISSADILLKPNTIQELCSPFKNKEVGMTGGHPIPLNKPTTFIHYAVHILWELHHEIALKDPKCGEIIAFRKIFKAIPVQTPVDEASIEAEIQKRHLIKVYTPKAIIQNKGPQTVQDFIQQRRRINAGHLWLKKHHHYNVSTNRMRTVIPLMLTKFSTNIQHNIWLIGTISLELWSKFLARIDSHLLKKNYTLWEQVQSTKNLRDL